MSTTNEKSSLDENASGDPPGALASGARAERIAGWLHRFQTTLDFRKTLELLHSFGFSDAEIAVALDATDRSVRRWRSEPYSPTRPHPVKPRECLDDLRALVSFFLADGTLDEWDIVSWLLSRRRELDFKRPIELVAVGKFELVLKVAEQFLANVPVTSAVELVDGEALSVTGSESQ